MLAPATRTLAGEFGMARDDGQPDGWLPAVVIDGWVSFPGRR